MQEPPASPDRLTRGEPMDPNHEDQMEATHERADLPATMDEVRAWVADASPAAVEAQVSYWMRELSAVTAETAALEEREALELDHIRRHYAARLAPLLDRAGELTRCAEAVAEVCVYPKGKKSAALAWGTIGRRTVPEAVSVADPVIAVATARTLLPSAIRVKESVDVKAIAPAVLASIADGGVVPDGFEHTAEYEKPYVKLNSRADA